VTAWEAERRPNVANSSLATGTVVAGKLRASVTSDDREKTAAVAAAAGRHGDRHGDDVDDDDDADGYVTDGKTVIGYLLEAAQ